MRIVCENKKCTGCLACVVTCMDHHYPVGAHNAVSLRRYAKSVRPSGFTQYITDSCRHCANAPCIEKCPKKAIRREESGWTTVDRSQCIGCGMCLKVCPFDIPQFDSERKMVKCDGCGGGTNCVKICPNGALSVER